MPMPSSQRFLEILVHDLRSPLNVLKLTLHVLNEVAKQGDSELAEDVGMMRLNVDEIDRMLAALIDYGQVPAESTELRPMEFDLARMLRDLVDHQNERNPKLAIRLEVQDAPSSVQLDPELARQAWSRALDNAASAAIGKEQDLAPIRVEIGGGPDRCIVQMIVESAPRDSVVATELRPDDYQRILGNAAERRGFDLALVAQVSELFGGKARLDVERGAWTALVLDWPRELS